MKGWWTARYNHEGERRSEGIIGANLAEVLRWAANDEDAPKKDDWWAEEDKEKRKKGAPYRLRFVREGVDPRNLVFDDYYELGGGVFDELAPYNAQCDEKTIEEWYLFCQWEHHTLVAYAKAPLCLSWLLRDDNLGFDALFSIKTLTSFRKKMLGLWSNRNEDDGTCAEGQVYDGLDELMDTLKSLQTPPPTHPNEWTYNIRFISAKEGVDVKEAVEEWVFDASGSDDFDALKWLPIDNGVALPQSDEKLRVCWGGADRTVTITELGELFRDHPPIDCDVKVGFVQYVRD